MENSQINNKDTLFVLAAFNSLWNVETTLLQWMPTEQPLIDFNKPKLALKRVH